MSGFVSLALQIIWSRLLAQILGPTTYAFSLVVAIFIAGLAIGAVAGRRLAARATQPSLGLVLGIAAAVLAPLQPRPRPGRWNADSWRSPAPWPLPTRRSSRSLLRQVLLAALWLGPLAIALGCVFPFAVKAGTGEDASLGADLGFIYAVNTIGAIAGALAAGFILIPRLGLYDSLRALGVAAALCALVLAWLAGLTAGARRWASAACALAALAGATLPPWSPALLSSGAYKYASTMSGDALDISLLAGRLLYYRDGAMASVAVREAAGTTSLAIDGKVDASNAGDMLTQRLLAHVPLLLHPTPRRAAILGPGSASRSARRWRHPLERADVLEISPEVVQASRFFEPENSRALADPRVRLIVGDGRTHLMLSRESYDVIVSEPSNPWMAGIASLFTREFFAAARARLAPGGVLCQWAHTYDISAEDLRAIVATFASVFPDGTMWLVGDGDVLLVGGTEPLIPRIAAVDRVWASRGDAVADLDRVGARDPFSLVSLLVAEGDGLAALRRRCTDADRRLRPGGVLGAAHGLLAGRCRQRGGAARTGGRDARCPWSTLPGPPPGPSSGATGAGCCSTPALPARPGPTSRPPCGANPEIAAPSRGWSVPAPPPAGCRRRSPCSANWPRRPTGSRPRWPCPGSWPRPAPCRKRPGLPSRPPSGIRPTSAALEQLASVLSDVGDKERLLPVVSRLRTIAPTADATRYYSASLLFLDGRTDQAIAEARVLVDASPGHARGHNLLGAALATAGRREAARDAFLASLEAEPRDPSTYTNLGLLELETGNRAAGLQRLAEALMLDPNAGAAREAYARETARDAR